MYCGYCTALKCNLSLRHDNHQTHRICMKNYSPKSLLTMLLLALLPLSAHATGWSSEVIIVKGKEWSLLEKPLNSDSTIRAKLEEFLPKDRSWSTANWDGFTSYWEIIYGRLYLKKIVVYMYDRLLKKEYDITYSAHDLKELFAPHYTAHGIRADWVTDKEFRMGRGEVLIYFHAAYNRNYEEELILSVDSGEVTSHKYWRNSIAKEGLEIEEAMKRTMTEFPVDRFPILNERRTVLQVRDFKLHPDGRFIDCNARLHLRNEAKEVIEDQNHPIIQAAKGTMRNIYPWKVYCIYGEFTPMQVRYMIPLWPRKKE